MGAGLARWRSLGWRDRARLLGCAGTLPLIHASLALAGHARTRRWIEAMTRRPSHAASATELDAARALAKLAEIAGRRGAVEATCLRQSLLVHGWLRRRGLRPQLLLGVPEKPGPRFEAHAWVELEGQRLLARDAGYRPFTAASHPAAPAGDAGASP